MIDMQTLARNVCAPYLSDPRKARVMGALRVFAHQRPGLEFGNYGDVRAYRSEMRGITKDLHHFRELAAAVDARSITADDLIRAASNRLTIHEDGDKVRIEYCTGQYWPTEYRPAACRVLVSALWDYWRAYGDDPRAMARHNLSRGVASRWFN